MYLEFVDGQSVEELVSDKDAESCEEEPRDYKCLLPDTNRKLQTGCLWVK